MSQTDFAALAGAKKGTQISWEKDASAPNAIALIAFAEAGADVLYILTGRRTNDGPDLSPTTVAENVAQARTALLDPHRFALSGESHDQTEERVLQQQIEVLSLILGYGDTVGTAEQLEEARSLLDIATNPNKLISFRAADHAQNRSKRKRIKERILSYIEMNDKQPSDEAVNLMTAISLDHNVPIGPLVDLAIELLSNDKSDER
ncbi:hypothetical protein [Sphingomonas melonis]|uniref:hypothetical protein n=1 Tax=Sphingomonas melonis TaxID=152682 RepID=UPI0035C7A49B